jgi:hypothetical protein
MKRKTMYLLGVIALAIALFELLIILIISIKNSDWINIAIPMIGIPLNIFTLDRVIKQYIKERNHDD